MSSPVSAYVRDRLEIDPGLCEKTEAVFDDWKSWCEARNRKPGSEQGLGKLLRAVIPGLTTTQPNEEGVRHRQYEGVKLKVPF
jgi:putative DNA primase/helicase